MNIVILGAGTAGLVTALIIREKYPASNITIVKSGDIGIIGVGEGSTEHWAEFIDFVGIDRLELIHETKATVKIGILFKDWNPGTEYVHSVHDFNISGLGRPELYHHLYLNNTATKFPLSPNFERVFYKNYLPVIGNLIVSYQYHFDTFKLNTYLTKKCIERNINFIEAVVTDILQDDTGNVTHLVTEENNIPGDLFIDGSGFKRVISSKLGVKWESKSAHLPMNRAINFPTEFKDPREIEPYTTATALSAGWAWKIPTQERYGNGYVFNADYITPDQALGEISQSLNVNVEKFAKDIKFEAGKVDKFWVKNVVSVGLASSFAEPLEAQSIGFTIIQAMKLISYLDNWQYNKKIVDQYNEDLNNTFDNVIDYLQLHYLNKRTDSKFWQEKSLVYTDFIRENIVSFTQGIIEPSMFKNTRLMFNVANFYQVLSGLDLISKQGILDLQKSNRENYNDYQRNAAAISVERAKEPYVIKHIDYLNLISSNYLLRTLNEN